MGMPPMMKTPQTMKAWVLRGVNDLRFEDAALPVPGRDEVLVEVKAAGICASDLPRIFETGTYDFPLIPGHEFSGIVTSASEWGWLGKRVGVFPLIPCMSCDACARGWYEICSAYSYIGSRRNGAFAAYVAVPSWNLVELPEEISFEEAAILEPAAVALHAVKQLDWREINSIAVLGVGPVGLLIAQWARIYGAEKILLIGTAQAQNAMALRLGFSYFCNIKTENAAEWILEQTGGMGADACVDAAGSGQAVIDCIRSARAGGRILLVGNPRGDLRLEKDIYWRILRKQLKISGSWNSRFGHEGKNDWIETIEAVQAGGILLESLITHRFVPADLAQGMNLKRERREYCCKIMITNR
jgi:L-iditol 2-dehydrogenase